MTPALLYIQNQNTLWIKFFFTVIPVTFFVECVNPLPLGMENGEIKGSQLSVSSKSNKESGANNGRLNVAAKPGVNIGAWMANAGNPPHHYKVDFLQKIKLYGILTQGRQDDVSWTKTFSFCYGVKEDNYRCYKEHGNLRVNT